MSIFFHPQQSDFRYLDPESQIIMQKTINFFEQKGLAKIKEDEHERVWYADFLDFVKREQIFATLLTPSGYGAENSYWDMTRICAMNEILGFYGLSYWYTWQVSILGLGPIWMSANEAVKHRTAKLLQEGGIFAFGLSEKEHGADLYASDMTLSPVPNASGQYRANGRKYYIGNGNAAALVSTFGKMEQPTPEGKADFVFFVTDSQHPQYTCHRDLINSQNYVAELEVKDYPITEADILARGQAAWDTALNTVNVGKFNLGFAAIGLCTHSFYEAINHASQRYLFKHYVTDFVHIKQLFTDAYCRLVAMKAFSTRSIDYLRHASESDRRYLLYNSLVKMKVTTQAEEVMNALWDIIAAKGFEKDTYFSMAVTQIRGLPKLEGTVHVNMALIIKFMKNYFFNPGTFPEVGRLQAPGNDAFLFRQGSTRGLGKIQFHDYQKAYDSKPLANVKRFQKQIKVFKQMLMLASPSKEQTQDFDFLLIVGELFSLVVYGQLILENALDLEDDLLAQIFDVMIRDFSKFALQLYSKSSSTARQRFFCLRMIQKPVPDNDRYQRIWEQHIAPLSGKYVMSP